MAAELVKNLYLFKDFTPSELGQMNQIVSNRVYNPGDEIFAQGDKATSIYMIKLGTIKIQQKGRNEDLMNLATLGSGSHFGEMSFLDGEPRSATAVAIEKSEVVVIDYDQLRSHLVASPVMSSKFHHALAHFLCGRLRVTTLDLSFAREKNLRHF